MKNLYKLIAFLFLTGIFIYPLLASGQKTTELDYNELKSLAELRQRAASEKLIIKNTPYDWRNVTICSYQGCIPNNITPVFDIVLKDKPRESGLVFINDFYVSSFKTALLGERFKATRQGQGETLKFVIKTRGESNFKEEKSPRLEDYRLGSLYLVRVQFASLAGKDFQEINKSGLFFKGTVAFTYNDKEELKTINYNRALQKALLLLLNIDNTSTTPSNFQGDVYTIKFEAVAIQGNTISIECLFYIILD